MQAKVEVILLPYDSANGQSMLARLIDELSSGSWTRFRAAVAFARASGNDTRLLQALKSFSDGGGEIRLTFGADTFAGDAKGSDYEAIEEILSSLDPQSDDVHLYHGRQHTFHPKVYLFDDCQEQQALLIIGSSNWSGGGLVTNVEANIAVHLDLSDESHAGIYNRMADCLAMYWSEP